MGTSMNNLFVDKLAALVPFEDQELATLRDATATPKNVGS